MEQYGWKLEEPNSFQWKSVVSNYNKIFTAIYGSKEKSILNLYYRPIWLKYKKTGERLMEFFRTDFQKNVWNGFWNEGKVVSAYYEVGFIMDQYDWKPENFWCILKVYSSVRWWPFLLFSDWDYNSLCVFASSMVSGGFVTVFFSGWTH